MGKLGTPAELADTSRAIFIGLLIYMPLHILISTWAGTSLGVLTAAKVAKDGVMLTGFLTAVAAAYRQPWFKELLSDRLIRLILIFAGLNVLLALIKPTHQVAETLGLVYNTRFLVFFLYGLLLAKLFDPKKLLVQSLKAVLATATFVLFFGIVQYSILPDDALTRIGYARQNGVLPAFFIDDKPGLERVMSTLRDPNSLGAYIIIIGSIGLAVLVRSRIKQQRKVVTWLLVLSLLCLVFTFSRSAWLGMLASSMLIILLSSKFRRFLSSKGKKAVIVIGLIPVIAGVLVFALKDNFYLQNYLFHTSSVSVNPSSNIVRNQSWATSVQHITDQPLGEGPGTAGPASMHNEQQGAVINENYYLQTAHELGVLGLVLFMAILIIVGLSLFKLAQNDSVALGLFASFIGIGLTNIFLHTWANEAVAYTWWGLAGIVLFTGSEFVAAGRGKAKRQSRRH